MNFKHMNANRDVTGINISSDNKFILLSVYQMWSNHSQRHLVVTVITEQILYLDAQCFILCKTSWVRIFEKKVLVLN